MSTSEQTYGVGRMATSEFAHEVQLRIVEASASLQAAEALGDTLTASIAASDLADMRSLAVRNDVDPDEDA